MKVFVFHLMPYTAFDLEEIERHNSAWVTLPNSNYDPELGPGIYNRYIDELVYADELGFDGVGVNEHHQTAYGLMPVPAVIAGALARETKQAQITVLGRALPLLNNPLTVAEEYAMIDNISGGRLIAGFVRGIGAEYHSWSSNPAFSHERFHEAHDLIIRAWTETGPIAFEGKHYEFNYVNVWPRPVQTPHPPVWIPSQGSLETVEWASHPDRRYVYLQTFSPVVAVAKYLALYRECAERYGYEATPDQLGWAVPIHVGESDEAARRDVSPHIEIMRNKFLRMPFEMLMPPGYTSVESFKRITQAKASIFATQTVDSLTEHGMLLCGSAETVRDRLLHYQREMGFNVLIGLFQFGTLPGEATRNSMKLFAEKVLPGLREQ